IGILRHKKGKVKPVPCLRPSCPWGKCFMSRHVSRKQRWQQENATSYTSAVGKVFYERGAWYGLLEYRTRAPGEPESSLAQWVAHTDRLGPFKRPRNAMVALEREATFLQNHHGQDLLFDDQ